MTSPHGIPVDLLDRLVIIRTQTYGPAEMIQVGLHLTVLLQFQEYLYSISSLNNPKVLRYLVLTCEADFSNPCSSWGADCGWGKSSLPWGDWTTHIFKVYAFKLLFSNTFLSQVTYIKLYLFLRHAVQLLSPASVVAKMNGRDSICKVIHEIVGQWVLNECMLSLY